MHKTIKIELNESQIKNIMKEQIIEFLAEKVHESWQEEKHKQGIFDHPDDKPYKDLADNIKEYDRATVRSVLKALASCC